MQLREYEVVSCGEIYIILPDLAVPGIELQTFLTQGTHIHQSGSSVAYVPVVKHLCKITLLCTLYGVRFAADSINFE